MISCRQCHWQVGLALVFALLWCTACEKTEFLAGMFSADLRLENTSDSDLLVTPLGRHQNYHLSLCLLPVFSDETRNYYSPYNRQLEIKAHSSRVVTFNYDDVQFSGIVLVTAKTGARSIVVYEDDLARCDCCGCPLRERYYVDAVSTGAETLRRLAGLDIDDLFEWFGQNKLKDRLLVSNMVPDYHPIRYENQPKVVSSLPGTGASEVAPETTAVLVAFDQDMMTTIPVHWWISLPGPYGGFEMREGARWVDPRTCELSVSLEAKKEYRVDINRPGFWEFRNTRDVPASTRVLVFETTSAQTR